ncbi:hypothetical protein SNOG_05028 [Parastagonospora nodorum SN15]|uniref:Uncharacterized protein n=1 Tax=Phaeosphaeria nodorum (strain SN15 / ATCC MYA-4574 / FGSC 10173) TaxID=321614 RepID=Q0UT86_PHANO|nr:hypothetical protein SNOG_05028 [Parastagonospora nodorum SN15]EAT87419.1 hypothetical protein SNOG_05028 [Parastagonospora nodorum SN15]
MSEAAGLDSTRLIFQGFAVASSSKRCQKAIELNEKGGSHWTIVSKELAQIKCQGLDYVPKLTTTLDLSQKAKRAKEEKRRARGGRNI